MKYAVIFDMDGVLINSPKYIWQSFNILVKDSGVHFSDKDIKRYLGRSLRDVLKLWRRDFGIKEYNPKEFSKKAFKIELELMKKELKPNLALKNLIRELKNKNVKLAVATSSTRGRAEKILDFLKIRKDFDVLITAENIKNHKPNPEIFLETSKHLKVNPENCVVVEDALSGIEAARSANMKVIGLVSPYQTKKELKRADLIIENFPELSYNKIKDLF